MVAPGVGSEILLDSAISQPSSHPITAHAPGVVSEVRVEVDQMVEPDEVLVVVKADE